MLMVLLLGGGEASRSADGRASPSTGCSHRRFLWETWIVIGNRRIAYWLAGGGGRAARAAAALGAADGCRQGVPAARPGRRSRGRAGAAGGALCARARDRRAGDQHGPLDRGGDPAGPREVLAPAAPRH